MAWRSSGTTNASLVENLWRNNLLASPLAKRAFLAVDRAHYAPSRPYEDSPQPIGSGATISAPHMHAAAVESLLPYLVPVPVPVPGSGGEPEGNLHVRGPPGRPRRVLDVGSGSGYLTHVLAELVEEEGVVVGLEHIGALKELGETNVGKSEEGRRFLESGRVRFRKGDGRKGWMETDPGSGIQVGGNVAPMPAGTDSGRDPGADGQGGWDAIHVGAAAVKLHDELVRQLRAPGRMFIPVEDAGGSQWIWVVDKDEKGAVSKERGLGVRYVPLTDKPGGG